MSEWIKWEGGDCPVDGDARVVCKYRDGEIENEYFAKEYKWRHTGANWDIVAYKIIDNDPVNKPSHYALLPGVEVIDVRDALFAKMPIDTPHDVADCWSRSWEYLTRMWGKNGLEDAKKARFYLDRMIAKMEVGDE